MYLLLSALAVGATSYLFLQNSTNKQRRFDLDYAESLSNKLSGELGIAAGILSSVTSAQQVLDDPYGDQLDSMAERSIDASSLIKSLARYERVEAENLGSFEQYMSEAGVYNFTISSLSTAGKKVPSEIKDVYYPITWRQPFDPLSAALIGIDLSSNSDLYKSIRGGESTNSIQVTKKPIGWENSQQSDLLLITPTYFGRYAPSSESHNDEQSNGGMIMGISLSEFIEKNELLNAGFDIEVWLAGTSSDNLQTKNVVFSLVGTRDKLVGIDYKINRIFSELFKGINVTSSPLSGNSTLRVSIVGHGGVHQSMLKQAMLLALCAAVAALFLIVSLYSFRRRDVVHRRDRESALTTLKAIGDAVVTVNHNRVITYTNPSAQMLLNKTNEELIGNTLEESIVFTEDRRISSGNPPPQSIIDSTGGERVVSFSELKLAVGCDAPVYVSVTVSALGIDDSSEGNGHVIVMRDISAERELTLELAFLATHDSLTKISNRYHFENELKQLIHSSLTMGGEHAICYIDIDQFKTINDTCGHSAGDQLLVRVSQGLIETIRDTDILARLGGDEFGLLIRDCNEEDSVILANSIYNYFQTMYFQHEEDVFAVRASIGFVHISGQFETIEDVMAAADLACYSAKDRGRNELYVFNHYNDETSDRMSEMMWLPKLQMALRCDSFRLFVQPIVDVQSEDETLSCFGHYEVLLRLKAEDGSLITPAQLIVAAERYNLMKDIDRWVISNAFNFISCLERQMGPDVPRFSINISGQSSMDSDFPAFIKEEITKSGIDPCMLVFEITETAAITNMQSAVKLVDFLHEIGCKLALDDFGSGVSSFGYLKTLPVDYLKIDGQFIKNIDNSDVDKEMVKCMKAVARILDIKVVAEFVERQQIVDVLRSLDIEYGQGYHYAKPHPIEDLLIIQDENKAA